VEAKIGRVYVREGLEAAFQWIEHHLLPLFERQEANQTKRHPQRFTSRRRV
jgi:dsRNA-specific ribonuclease